MDEKELKDEELESVGGGLALPGVSRAAGAARVYDAASREDTAFQIQTRLMDREELRLPACDAPPAGGAPRAGGEAPPAGGGEPLSGSKFSPFEGK